MAYNKIEALITALGGVSRVADEFGCTTQAISNWIAENEVPRSREARMLQLVVRAEAEQGKVIDWRPAGWDRRIELRFNPARAAA